LIIPPSVSSCPHSIEQNAVYGAEYTKTKKTARQKRLACLRVSTH